MNKKNKSHVDLAQLAQQQMENQNIQNQFTEYNTQKQLDTQNKLQIHGISWNRRNSLIDVNDYNKDPDITKLIPISDIYQVYMKLRNYVTRTNTEHSNKLSDLFQSNIYFKRVYNLEDQQIVRSYKLRGALNKILSLSESDRQKGIVTCSAGNHAQGVAYVCNLLKIRGTIFMPVVTPPIKISAVKSWGKEYVDVKLIGDTYDESQTAATKFCSEQNQKLIPPFNDLHIIQGQATIGIEILEDIKQQKIDYLFFPIGGGGLGSGLVSVFKQLSKETILVGCQPLGAPSMKVAFEKGEPVELDYIDTFVDGGSVKCAGDKTFKILKEVLTDICLVPEGEVCTTMIHLFNNEGILVEPAGALAISALNQFKEAIKGKTVVCIVSGSNNDLGRMHDIRMLSDMYQGKQYYMLVNFYQKPGALKQFITECLEDGDEITNIDYTKKCNREKGPALVGLSLKSALQFEKIKNKMKEKNISYKFLNPDQEIFKLLI